MGQVSGLAPTGQRGPFGKCIINGSRSAEQQALHGGPIPMLSGAHGSRGIPEVWPYLKPQVAERGFGNQKNYFDQTRFLEQPRWANLNWTIGGNESGGGLVPAVTPVEAYGGYSLRSRFQRQQSDTRDGGTINQSATETAPAVNQRFNSDGSRQKRGSKQNPNRKEGVSKH